MQLQQISWEEARALVDEGGQLVDVRGPDEFARGSIEGAVNIPVQILPQQVDQLDREKPVVLFCATGARSMQAQMLLGQLGFENVHNLGSVQKAAAG
ncbi:MAG: rhodanese-like domain-containing protein [Pseudomonadota bacterium]